MAAVVHARRDLVDQHLVAGHEELDAIGADDPQAFADRRRRCADALGHTGADARRYDRGGQHAVIVLILADREGDERTVGTARADDRNFEIEGHEAFVNQRRAARVA